MKRYLIAFVAIVATVALVAPVYAIDASFSGYADARYTGNSNLSDGVDTGSIAGVNTDDNNSYFENRFRLYFTGTASENLKGVVRWEIDNMWGHGDLGDLGADGSSQGEDGTGMEIKNAYIDFNVPGAPLSVQTGIFGARVGKRGFVLSDDVSGIAATYMGDPHRFTLIFSKLDVNPNTTAFESNTDDGHDTNFFGADYRYTSESIFAGVGLGWIKAPTSVDSTNFGYDENTNLYLIDLEFDYSTDVWSAFITAEFNTGTSEDRIGPGQDSDFGGWMTYLGGDYNFEPVTVGLRFVYASGEELNSSGVDKDNDIDAFVTTGGGAFNEFSEAWAAGFTGNQWAQKSQTIGLAFNSTAGPYGAPVDNSVNGLSTGAGTNGGYAPSNLLGIQVNVGGNVTDTTYLQGGFAYLQHAEDVVSDSTTSPIKLDDKIGYELFLRLVQDVVDGLQFKGGFGYLFADDGYSTAPNDDDAYALNLGFFWSF
jgi:hypothetical protein